MIRRAVALTALLSAFALPARPSRSARWATIVTGRPIRPSNGAGSVCFAMSKPKT